MKRVHLFICTVLCSTISYAQETPFDSYIPPSPEASALMEYAAIPVDLYNGIPDIDLPLYTLKGRSMDIPISLSYHSSGIKVQDIASSVGLGWTLNAGGVITRVVRGIPDDDKDGYVGVNARGSQVMTPNTDFMSHVNRNNWDSEPDVFFFNFLGNTGKFVLDYNGNVMLLPENDFKIIPAIGPQAIDHDWTIIDKQGVRYRFGVTEITKSTFLEDDFPCPSPRIEQYISSWYLSEITFPGNSEVINFRYITGHNTTYRLYKQIHYTSVDRVLLPGMPPSPCRFLGTLANVDVEIEVVNPKYIYYITTDFGEVFFWTRRGRI